MKTLSNFGCGLALAAALLGLAGCTLVPEPKADPTRNYVMTATTQPGDAVKEAPKNKPFVALRPVETPAWLRGRRSIAVRHGANEIVYHEFERWAEAPEDGVARVVSERLLASGSVSGVAILPSRAARDCELTIRVLECEGAIADGSVPVVRFAANYELTLPGAGTITGTRHFVATPASWDGRDFSALASVLGQSVSALADEIAKNLPAK